MKNRVTSLYTFLLLIELENSAEHVTKIARRGYKFLTVFYEEYKIIARL